MDDEKFMLEALKEAEQAFEEEEVPIGAVCVFDSEIIGRGRNRIESLKDPTAHAEILAITAASSSKRDWRLDGITIYVTVEPCLMCFGAILQSRIDRLVFGCKEPKTGFTRYRIDHNIDISSGIKATEALRLLEDFFRLRRD